MVCNSYIEFLLIIDYLSGVLGRMQRYIKYRGNQCSESETLDFETPKSGSVIICKDSDHVKTLISTVFNNLVILKNDVIYLQLVNKQ
jgi:hypothetical protein